MPRQRYSDAVRKKAAKLYLDKKLTIDEIAAMDGFPSSVTLIKWFQEDGVPTRSLQRIDRRKLEAEIIRHPQTTTVALASKYGCSPSWISRIRMQMRESGALTRPKKKKA